MKKISRKELIFFITLLILSAFPRFQNLNYSTYYGDETKTLYVDKTITAVNFLLNQRKGPIQFLAAWFMEKVSLGYAEGFIRPPFALAGLLSVVVFYVLVRKLFGWRPALISSILFSFNGFNIAFSRTAQYQSFLILFGILSIYLFIIALEKKSKLWFTLSSLSMILCFYSHYDAVFFLIPILFLLINPLRKKEIKLKDITYFFVPLVVLLSVFYLPFVFKGYFEKNVVNYLERRVTGESYARNNSLYTYYVYNPCYAFFIPFLSLLILFFERRNWKINLLVVWFLGAFIPLELAISNPGTHIHNYFLPFYMLCGYCIYRIYSLIKSKRLKAPYLALTGLLAFVMISSSIFIYSPIFKSGYPWKRARFLFRTFERPDKNNYHLYLYGFPYDRGWREIQEYVYSLDGVRGVYTNDNEVVARYYLMKIDYKDPGSNYLPPYYIHVFNNQEFTNESEDFYNTFISNYTEVRKIFVGNELSAVIFKLKTPQF